MVHIKKHGKTIFLNLILIVLFWIIAGGNFNLKAQSINERTSFNTDEISNYVVKEFSATEVNSMIYFRFTILENQENTQYVLESSNTDSDIFTEEAKKDGFQSPNHQPLLYCYNLNQDVNNDKKYRIKMISENGINYSKEIKIKHLNTQVLAHK